MKGLGSQLASFLFKLVHGLLPSQDRVATVGLAVMGTCQQCSLEVEDLEHCFFRCPKNSVSGLTLLGWVQSILPSMSPETALCLKFDQDLNETEELAVVTILAIGLKYIWEARTCKKPAHAYKMRAEMEAKIAILRKTRYSNIN